MIGDRLGPYTIDRELGAGGMGTVYAATGPDGVVALKVVHPHLLATPGFFKRFLREAQLGQSISHDNVVRTLDCDQEFGSGAPTCFLVMEYVAGQTLSALVRELGRVPEQLCRHVAREICTGLAAIHEAGIVHRDLKPENVIISLSAAKPDDHVAERPTGATSRAGTAREGNVQPRMQHVVKIMDLGVARLADEQMRLSQSGAFVGSVEYAAPEQFKGGEVDGRTDLHALGVLLYELSSGQHPYRGGGFHEAMRRVCEVDARRLGEVNPQLSPFFEEFVHTLLVKDPRGRFASAAQTLEVLEQGEESDWWHARARALRDDTRRPIRRVRIPRETAVYGRDEELATLRSLWDRARAGEAQVVLIEGEAGIGKSRLVDELVARLHADGEDLSFLFGSYPPGGAASAAGAFAAAYREHFGESGCVEHLAAVPLLVPAFDALLRGEPAPTGVVPLSQDAVGTCFVRATQSLAAERATIVLIDDLHFASEEARALFTTLALGVQGSRVLLVGTARPGLPDEWIAGITRLDNGTRIALPRLGPKDLAALLQDSFNSRDLAEQLAFQIGTKSDGNPFFAFEIIRGLREGQFITRRNDGTWASTRVIDEIQIPSSVLDLVNARVAGLSEDERNLLDVAACWGYAFDPLLIGEVLGIARIPLLRQLGQIERRHRLVRAAGREYVFDHHQIQEALYGSLSELLREEYHAALAETLEARAGAGGADPESLPGPLCVDLCRHYLQGARGEAAVRYLDAARQHLQRGFLHAEAAALMESALAVPGLLCGEPRVRALLGLAGNLDVLGRRDREEECTLEAAGIADTLGDLRLQASSAAAHGSVLMRTARYDEAEAAVRRSIELSHAAGDADAEINSSGRLGIIEFERGRFASARAHFTTVLEHHRARGDVQNEAVTTMNLGNALCALGDVAGGQALFERALALHREKANLQAEASVHANLGTLHARIDQMGEARVHFERALALSRSVGHRRTESIATGGLARVVLAEGRHAEGLELQKRCLELSRAIGYRRGEATAMSMIGVTYAEMGEFQTALGWHERHLQLSREIGNRAGEANALLNSGITLGYLGENKRAERAFLESIDVLAAVGDRRTRAMTYGYLGSVRLETGDEAGARDALVTARDLADELRMAPVAVLARVRLALLPGGDVQDALAAYEALGEHLTAAYRRDACFALFRATGDTAHLREARRLVDEELAALPASSRPRWKQAHPECDEIVAACREAFGDEEDDEPRGTESLTRVG